MDSVLIVVLNWNNIAETEQCLVSLSNQTYSDFKILVIDNGSSEPGTTERLSTLESDLGDQLKVVRNLKNLGFAGGVNTGIRYGIDADFDYIALFNNDARADKDWLAKLVEAAEQNSSAVTTGLLLHEDGKTIDSTGDWYSIWGLPFPRGRGLASSKSPDSGVVFGGSGGATLYKTSLFEKIGLFDERFFAYYEDVDISFRAQLAGYTAWFEKSAIAYHKRGATSNTLPGFAVKQTLKNLPLLYIKNVPTSLLIPVGLRFWAAYYLITAKALLSRNFASALRGYLEGVWYFWTDALPQRARVQGQKRVSDSYVKELLWHDLPPDQTGLRKLFRKSV